jgi:hypothetical protein
MNALQKIVLVLGIVAVVGMGIYPPWVHTIEACSKPLLYGSTPTVIRQSQSIGYSFISQPPAPIPSAGDEAIIGRFMVPLHSVQLDAARLFVQEAIAVIATVMGVLLFKKVKPMGL